MPTSRPNVLYILADEHRGQVISHMGDPNVETPVMDRLACQGVSFSRADGMVKAPATLPQGTFGALAVPSYRIRLTIEGVKAALRPIERSERGL